MEKEEAIQAMREGKKVFHSLFSNPEEWVMLYNHSHHLYIFEDGVKVTAIEFWKYRNSEEWEVGWEIFAE